jgi:hypothetical protein
MKEKACFASSHHLRLFLSWGIRHEKLATFLMFRLETSFVTTDTCDLIKKSLSSLWSYTECITGLWSWDFCFYEVLLLDSCPLKDTSHRLVSTQTWYDFWRLHIFRHKIRFTVPVDIACYSTSKLVIQNDSWIPHKVFSCVSSFDELSPNLDDSRSLSCSFRIEDDFSYLIPFYLLGMLWAKASLVWWFALKFDEQEGVSLVSVIIQALRLCSRV